MIGKLNCKIKFQEKVQTPDGAGGVTSHWKDLPKDRDAWARVFSKEGHEDEQAGRMNAVYTVIFEIWNRRDISELNRIVWNDEVYNIKAVLRTASQSLTMKIEAQRGVAS